jgi:hypothetical protein
MSGEKIIYFISFSASNIDGIGKQTTDEIIQEIDWESGQYGRLGK